MRFPPILDNLRVPNRHSPYGWSVFFDDLKAGVVLFLVEIPFAMGIGVVSGMGIPAALYCLVIVGIVGAIFGGTRAMVSGPSVAVAVIVASVFHSGEVGPVEFGIISVMAGLMQILFGFAGIGRVMAYLPHIVLTGFISGIGLFLVWSQSWHLVKLGVADIGVAGTCLGTILLWPRRWQKFVPGQLVGIGVAWVVSAFLVPGSQRLGPLPMGLPDIALAVPTLGFLQEAFGPALLIAAISSAYTLMIAQSADAMTGGRHNANRQLAATGMANMAAGIFGAVPGSGQFGAMAGLLLGGRTVIFGVVVSVLTAAFILGLGPYLATLPTPAIMAVVIWIGWELVDWRLVKRIRRVERRVGIVFLVTMGMAALGDPLAAVVIGVIIASVGNAVALERVEMDNVLSVPLIDDSFLSDSDGLDPFSARVGLLAFRGSFTVASSRRLSELLEEDIRDHEVALFDLSGMTHLDDSAANLLQLLLRKASAMGIEIVVFGIPDRFRSMLDTFDVLREVPESRVVESMEDAREIANRLLASGDVAES